MKTKQPGMLTDAEERETYRVLLAAAVSGLCSQKVLTTPEDGESLDDIENYVVDRAEGIAHKALHRYTLRFEGGDDE